MTSASEDSEAASLAGVMTRWRPEPPEFIGNWGPAAPRFGCDLEPGCRPPANAPLYLFQLQWTWTPLLSRQDSYFIDRAGDVWKLYCWHRNETGGPLAWSVVATGAFPGADARTAAWHLVAGYFRYEHDLGDTGRFMSILGGDPEAIRDLRAIAEEVWPD